MASPPSAAAAEELGSSPSEASPPPAQVSSPQGSSVSRIGKTPKVKPLKLGYLSFKEGNMLKKTFKPRFCILNKNNELEAYRDPNVRVTHDLLSPVCFSLTCQCIRTKQRATNMRRYLICTCAMLLISKTTRTMAFCLIFASTNNYTSCVQTQSRFD